MKNYNHFLKIYADMFDYSISFFHKNSVRYYKKTNSGIITMHSNHESKYVKFQLNGNTKEYKKSDLFLGVLEKTPLTWEEE